MIRKWFKEVVREVIKEEISNCPLIISSRAPNEHDIYAKDTIWLNGSDKYVANEVKVKWEKV